MLLHTTNEKEVEVLLYALADAAKVFNAAFLAV